ncbi:putative ATP-dependent zinc metalloprotease FTSH, chloroplastic [Cocos nucifera]|uniref:Putative ATP-dependent zinc metalloprotease FTSH, chloroplastic n=1 Tax=Cocos nucifera TaxID=13894 RepID=A0A8K0N095_COCNU|nr:putative ATP-dependent zinc metalloprotease FTSH, chloroplastic [Cocos nucifera]
MDSSALLLTIGDSRHIIVVVSNELNLIDILSMNGIDIFVFEDDSGNGFFAFINNFLFPFLTFVSFFLFCRA